MDYFIKAKVDGEDKFITTVDDGFTVLWESGKKAKPFRYKSSADMVCKYLQHIGLESEILMESTNRPENPSVLKENTESSRKKVYGIYDCDVWKTRSTMYIIAVADAAHLNAALKSIQQEHGYTDSDMQSYIYTESLLINKYNGEVHG